MPTYEYLCNTCGHRFEKFQRFSEDPIKDCPECGKEVRKVMHAPGIAFKGSGWYINDSRGTSSSAPKSDSTEAKSESSSETKAETKSEAKSDKSSEAA